MQPVGVGLWVEPEATARSRKPISSSTLIAPRTRAREPEGRCVRQLAAVIGKVARSATGIDQ